MSVSKNRRILNIALLVLTLWFSTGSSLAAITSPEKFLGFKPGQDRQLADWNQIVAYFHQLAEETGRVRVSELGKTTMGKPFLQVVISSEDNLAHIARYKEIESKLAESRRLSDADVDSLVREGKVVLGISCSIHSTEIAASQMSMQLAYDLVSGQFPDASEILSNVIIVMFPSANPDGIQIVSDWYRKELGTPYEGTSPPFLYHKYAGHDNNRDFFKLNLPETRMITQALWSDWRPTVYWDVHQMGFYGARLAVPPYSDPINPNINPVIVRELFTLGGFMTGDLAIAGKKGVMTMDRFDAWWVGGNRITPWFHNAVGILTEAASARVATPITVSPDRLSGREAADNPAAQISQDRRDYLQATFNFPNPWPGGTWRLADIIDYEMGAAHGLLRALAEQKDYFLRNFYRITQQTILEGEAGHPFAYVIPHQQHDDITAVNLVNLLIDQGIEVYAATDKFGVEGKSFDAGSYVIPLNQPYGRLVKTLFEIQHYPDMRGPNNLPERPYDVTGWTLPLLMGVEAMTIDSPFKVPLSQVTQETPSPGRIIRMKSKNGRFGYLLEHNTNNSILAMNRLQKLGYQIAWLRKGMRIGDRAFEAGTIFVLPPARKQMKSFDSDVEKAARDLSLTFYTLPKQESLDTMLLKTPRVGVYKSWVPSMDEGWTRFLFEKFEMPYQSITDSDIRAGKLNSGLDVIVLPQQSLRAIVSGNVPGSYPDEYTGGLGEAGVNNLRSFVSNGGTLLTLDTSSDLAIERLGAPVTNALQGLKTNEFYCPGTLLAVEADLSNPITYGMPKSFTVFFDNGRAFDAASGAVIARYRSPNPFQSGWLIGPGHIAGKGAIVDLAYGKGRLILFGFRPQFRGWTDETLKLIFNSLFYGSAMASTPGKSLGR